MWILTTVYSTSEWVDGPAGFLVEIDSEFVDAMRGINEAVQDAAIKFGARISHVDLSLDAWRYYVLDRDRHEEDVLDLLGIDELPDGIYDGSYKFFDENPFPSNPVEVEGDDTFSVRLDNGFFMFCSLSGDPELSTPEIALKELEEYV